MYGGQAWQWKRAHGFESRRSDFVVSCPAGTYRVTQMERVAGSFVRSPFYHFWLDNDYIGYAATVNAAKLACVLHYMEYCQ